DDEERSLDAMLLGKYPQLRHAMPPAAFLLAFALALTLAACSSSRDEDQSESDDNGHQPRDPRAGLGDEVGNGTACTFGCTPTSSAACYAKILGDDLPLIQSGSGNLRRLGGLTAPPKVA